jgi:DedD protein
MGLLSFLQRKNKPVEIVKSGAVDVAQLEHLRVRARHRLIGAVVLVSAAVLVLPRVFDSQPRPLSAGGGVKVEMVGHPELAASAAPTAAAVAASAEAIPAVPSPVAFPAASKVSPPLRALAGAASATTVPKTASQQLPPPATHRPTKTDSERAQALLEGRAEKKAASTPEAAVRFFVQAGAFEQPSAAHDMHQRVEQLGLAAHEQNLTTPAGRRIRVRVGPYTSREEANAVMARMRSGGLPAAIMVQ